MKNLKLKHWKRIVIAILLLCVVALGSIVTIGYIRYETLISEQPLDDVILSIQNDPDYVPLEEIDDQFIKALLAVEDPTFYQHNGVVFSNIMEALFTNLKEKELVMGGSTITQQLSKNLYLDQKKTFQRKVAELFFVHDLENKLSKDKILELYVNIIYFGDGYYGIRDACEGYFQTSPSNMTIAQATLLAGLPQAPAVYQLSDGMQLAKERQRIVLKAMQDLNLITETQSLDIYNQPV